MADKNEQLMKSVEDFAKDYKSKAEAEFEIRLKVGKQDGRIRRYTHECHKFKIGEAVNVCGKHETAWYTPDFTVEYIDGTVEQVEVKGGFIREAAMVRFKTAAMLYPRYRWAMWQKDKNGWVKRF